MARWGIAATLKARPEQVLAFAAHHLDLGAARVWLHFDDPSDPAAALLSGRDRVHVIRCDEAYWQKLCGKRPDTHQVRQIRNVTRVLRQTKLDWIAHFDVDEFLLAERPVAEILDARPPTQLVLRVEPWEALHAPELPDDIYSARAFRRQIPADKTTLAAELYGDAGRLLEAGMLSHTVGKCFFRTGIPEMVGRIHGARIKGEPVPGGRFHPDLALLHFHAEARGDWLARLPYRLERGAYQYRPAMQAWLRAAAPPEVEGFYDKVQRARPELLAALRAAGLLREETLNLRRRVERRFPDLV